MQEYFDLHLLKYQIDAIYVTDASNIRYITGFKGSFGIAIIIKEETILVTDQRYLDEAKMYCKNIRVIEVKSLEWQKIINNCSVIAFETKDMTIERFAKLKKKFNNPKWIPIYPIIENMRRQKNSFEISQIAKGSEITCDILNEVLKTIKENDTEMDIAWRLQKIAYESHNIEKLSFDPIVAFEENSAIPHHKTNNTKLKKGDAILIDFGIKYHGYSTDMTRTVFFQEVSNEKEGIYNKVLEAQKIGIDSYKLNKSCSFSHKIVNDYFKKNQLDEFFTHSLGHGIGLDTHEAPNISINSKDYFSEWDTISCEPGIYLPEKFGVRIEDIGVMRESGFEIFTSSPKELIVIK